MRLLLCLLVFVLPLAAQEKTAEVIRVACVGDSITAGYGLEHPERDAYPARLAQLLGHGWEVRNFGVSARTLMQAGDLPYDKEPACADALAWKPQIVVIALGTNDTKDWNIGRHPDDFVPSYHALIARFRQANPAARIFLCLPPPAFPAAMNIRETVLAASILPRIREVAAAEHLPLIDLHTEFFSDCADFPDRIHPDPAGARKLAEIVYGEIMTATQPQPKSLATDVNTAVIPVPRLEFDSYNWWRRHAAELDAQQEIDPEIVLIGDSITHFWAGLPFDPRRNGPAAWARTFGSHRVLNLGFGWDRTQNVLWRLDHGEFEHVHPRVIVLHIGTNNLAGTENSCPNTPPEIVAGILAICDRVQARAPEAELVVMAVFPRGRTSADGARPVIKEINTLLAQKLAGRAHTRLLDIGSRFLADDGSIPEAIMPDALHPSELGYLVWGQALEETGLLK